MADKDKTQKEEKEEQAEVIWNYIFEDSMFLICSHSQQPVLAARLRSVVAPTVIVSI